MIAFLNFNWVLLLSILIPAIVLLFVAASLIKMFLEMDTDDAKELLENFDGSRKDEITIVKSNENLFIDKCRLCGRKLPKSSYDCPICGEKNK